MPASRSKARTVLFVCAFSFLGTVALLLTAEIVVRIKFAIGNKDIHYLTIGILPDRRRSVAHRELAPLPQRPVGTVRAARPAGSKAGTTAAAAAVVVPPPL